MLKKELIEALQKKLELPSLAETERVYTAFTDAYAEMMEASKEKEPIPFGRSGFFKNLKRAGRVGRNPATGEEIQIPETTVITFKMSSESKNKFKGDK